LSNLKPVKVGLIGCGMIALRAYMPTILKQYSMIDVVKCADTIEERAKIFEEKFGAKACTNEDIYNDPEIEVVLNLTYPTSHYEVTKAALEAGKSVHCEKMMAVTWEQGLELAKIAEKAEKNGQWYTVAPDTFLGGAWQTIRQLIDNGFIGTPIASYCLVTRGNMILGGDFGRSTRREYPKQEGDNSDMFARMRAMLPGYNPRTPAGSGLPFDMGGYYLHNLINMFGNIERVSGFIKTNIKYNESKDPLNTLYKSNLANNEPDTLVGSLEFSNGVYGSIIFASGIRDSDQVFVVYGSEATLICPDPNFFGGNIFLQTNVGSPPSYSPGGLVPLPNYRIPPTHGYLEEARGVGLLDLAFAIRNGRKPRCHYTMGYQAFETVHGIIQGCQDGKYHNMVSSVERPAAVKPGIYSGFGQQSVFDD
jgi:predicted dehydrogenase